MCGIAGIIDYNRDAAIDKTVMHRMCAAMSHRGPDDEGIYVSPSAGPRSCIGHRRLSIIDLSSDGHQPMSNEDGSIVIAFNGEIYNYTELRPELESKGHRFRSGTDTETALHLYEEYGEDFVGRLKGMFAFAIWDENRKMLVLGRDRAGKKPLLYFHEKGRFVFASEFASILESGLIDKEINIRSVDRYLTFGYVPNPMTIYKNVRKLPPAHILVLKDNKAVCKRYWKLDYSGKADISEDDAASEVLRLLKQAVRARLNSDVPLGAFLSGGIDSSAVVAVMSGESAGRVKTFSIGFENRDYDELKYAANIARLYGTDHHELIVKPDAAKILPLLVERYGEPYADSSCIPTYYVAHETKRYVTVALNGDGGDEVFGGYERYQAMAAAEKLDALPLFLRNMLKSAASVIPDSADSKNILRRARRFFDGVELPESGRYARWISIFSSGIKDGLYSDSLKKELSAAGAPGQSTEGNNGAAGDLIDRLLDIDVNTYLPDDLLVKVDIAAMANSLEARSPFLDQDLMEFAASLPARYKVNLFNKKAVLKKAIKGLVPPENINRRKMGFGVPVGDWIRKDLKDMVMGSLFSEKSLGRSYFNESYLRKMVDDHMSGRSDRTFQVWALLMLELWRDRFPCA